MQKGSIVITTILIVVGILLAGVGGYKILKPTKNLPVKIGTRGEDCTSGWTEYKKEKFGFKLKVPSGWMVDETASSKTPETDSLMELIIISTTRPEEQLDPSYKISRFDILVSTNDLKSNPDYSHWFENNTGNQIKSVVDFKGLTGVEKYVDETEMVCSGPIEDKPACSHRFETYYFQRNKIYYLLNFGIYTTPELKEKNEKILKCFLDNFDFTEKEDVQTPLSELIKCPQRMLGIDKSKCSSFPNKPVCGYARYIYDNNQTQIHNAQYQNICFYCSDLDTNGFQELRGTKIYSLGYKEGLCQEKL